MIIKSSRLLIMCIKAISNQTYTWVYKSQVQIQCTWVKINSFMTKKKSVFWKWKMWLNHLNYWWIIWGQCLISALVRSGRWVYTTSSWTKMPQPPCLCPCIGVPWHVHKKPPFIHVKSVTIKEIHESPQGWYNRIMVKIRKGGAQVPGFRCGSGRISCLFLGSVSELPVSCFHHLEGVWKWYWCLHQY